MTLLMPTASRRVFPQTDATEAVSPVLPSRRSILACPLERSGKQNRAPFCWSESGLWEQRFPSFPQSPQLRAITSYGIRIMRVTMRMLDHGFLQVGPPVTHAVTGRAF